ncbi:hypothetical protein Dimus_010336 [Dionaea muscipula]
MHRCPLSISSLTIFIKSISNSKPKPQKSTIRLFSGRSFLHLPIQFPEIKTQLTPSLLPNPNPNPNFPEKDFTTLCSLLRNPTLSPGPDLENALEQTGIKPSPCLLQAIFDHLDSSPKPLFTLFKWAWKKPDFERSSLILNSIIDILGKSREFGSAWMLLLDHVDGDDGSWLVSVESFTVMIRRYARAGMASPAIRTFEFANRLDAFMSCGGGMDLFEVLLDALCKEGLVKAASEYLDRRRNLEPDWVPSVRVYNILLNGWFRVRKLKRVEQLLMQMKKENVVQTVVTYGTLVKGYCRMRRVERAIVLVDEMRVEGIEPNAVVYNPIVDALAEEGRFKEAMGMLERFLVLESGPTLSTYNSLVKGFCKAGDLVEASRILKMMISRGFVPTAMTYDYFLKYFYKHGKVEEAMALYNKMINSGYDPDRLAFHLLIKMLCEQERLELAVQVSKEMRARGCDMDLATSTMLVHLFCKMCKLEEAYAEFEDMIRRGIVPQFLTYQRMNSELKKRGLTELTQKLSSLMASVPHSTKLPNTYKGDEDASLLRRKSIMRKAKNMSNILKTCNNPRELVKRRSSSENAVANPPSRLFLADVYYSCELKPCLILWYMRMRGKELVWHMGKGKGLQWQRPRVCCGSHVGPFCWLDDMYVSAQVESNTALPCSAHEASDILSDANMVLVALSSRKFSQRIAACFLVGHYAVQVGLNQPLLVLYMTVLLGSTLILHSCLLPDTA